MRTNTALIDLRNNTVLAYAEDEETRNLILERMGISSILNVAF